MNISKTIYRLDIFLKKYLEQYSLAFYKQKQYCWTLKVNSRPELSRLMNIQRELKPNNLLLLNYIFPEFTRDIMFVLKIAVCPKMVSKCTMCDNDADDIILHIVMSCQHYLEERNSFFDIIVNILPV